MKHDDVVAALKIIAEKETGTYVNNIDLQELKSYKLVEITKGEEKVKNPTFSLTKKGRVMLKANSK
jgi:hypothetical protein